MDLRQLRTDPVKEDDGVWVSLDPTTRIKIARMYNPAFSRYLNELKSEASRAKRNMDEDARGDILARAMARHILVGWEGLTDDGEEFPDSEENALQLLNDITLRDFREVVLAEANNYANFALQAEEEERGN